MDIKHVLATNPLRPAYAADDQATPRAAPPPTTSGSAIPAGWCASATAATASATTTRGPATTSSSPRSRCASGLVTAGDWLEFIADGGYRQPALWMSDGWATVQAEELGGAGLLDPRLRRLVASRPSAGLARSIPPSPSCHVSWYEADAFARWAGASPADRGRVGGRGHLPRRRRGSASTRRRCTRDRPASSGAARSGSGPPAPTRRTRGSARGRRGRRVQRQVHGQPAGAAGRRLRHPAGPHPPDLPELLLPGVALGVQRAAAGGGRMSDFTPGRGHRRRPPRPRRPAGGPAPRRPGRAGGDAQGHASGVVLRRRGLRAVRARSPARPSTTRSAPSGTCCTPTPAPSPRRRGDGAGRAGLGHVREDPGAARRHGRCPGGARPATCRSTWPRPRCARAAEAVAADLGDRRSTPWSATSTSTSTTSPTPRRTAPRRLPRQHDRQPHAGRAAPRSWPTSPTCWVPTTASCSPPTWSSRSTG